MFEEDQARCRVWKQARCGSVHKATRQQPQFAIVKDRAVEHSLARQSREGCRSAVLFPLPGGEVRNKGELEVGWEKKGEEES